MQRFLTLELAIKYYEKVDNLSLPHHLKEQLKRSASSIALNLSEGNAKSSFKDKRRIYEIALGSFRESQTILRLAKVSDPKISSIADHLGACLYKLTKCEPHQKEKVLPDF